MVVLLCTTSGGGGGSTGSTMWMDTNETNVVVGAVIRLFEGGFREGKARKKEPIPLPLIIPNGSGRASSECSCSVSNWKASMDR